jgi:hypothetical protein
MLKLILNKYVISDKDQWRIIVDTEMNVRIP